MKEFINRLKILRKAKIVLVFVLSFSFLIGMAGSAAPAKETVRVLMIGNSMTMRKHNTTIKNLENLALKGGHKITIKYLAYSGEKLKNWANPKQKHGKQAYKEIKKGTWDYIILQENTDYAIAHGNTFVSASKKLAEYIHEECPDAEIIYNCTWAYAKTKKINGKKYSFSMQQKNMNRKYQEAAKAAGGTVCWSGKAFLQYRKTKNHKCLYLKDKNHATRYGWYLNACCLYTAIFQESPSRCNYYGGLNKIQAKRMQKIAAGVREM